MSAIKIFRADWCRHGEPLNGGLRVLANEFDVVDDIFNARGGACWVPGYPALPLAFGVRRVLSSNSDLKLRWRLGSATMPPGRGGASPRE